MVALASLAQISPRTVTEYLGKGLLTAPEFRGTATRYDRNHLVRLMAIRLSKADGERSLKAIKHKLEEMGNSEMESWISTREIPEAAARALGIATKPSASKAGPSPTSTFGSQTPASEATPAMASVETWKTLELMPGLELSLRVGAGPVAAKVANHLYAHVTRLIEGALADG